MYPDRYFNQSYFALRYWTKVGADPAAPVYESFNVQVESTDVLNITVQKPSGTEEDDLLFFVHGAGSATANLTPAAGAIVIDDVAAADRVKAQTSYIVASDSEPSSYTASSNTAENQIYGVLRISIAYKFDPILESVTNTGFSDTPVSPSVDVTQSDYLVIRWAVVANGNNTNTGYPAGTEGIYSRSSTGLLNRRVASATAHETYSSPGTVPAATWNLSPTEGYWIAGTTVVTSQPSSIVANGSAVSQDATASGVATVLVRHFASGSGTSQNATASGLATVTSEIIANGSGVSQNATASGLAKVIHYASGSAVSQNATANGIAQAGDGWTPVDKGKKETWEPVK